MPVVFPSPSARDLTRWFTLGPYGVISPAPRPSSPPSATSTALDAFVERISRQFTGPEPAEFAQNLRDPEMAEPFLRGFADGVDDGVSEALEAYAFGLMEAVAALCEVAVDVGLVAKPIGDTALRVLVRELLVRPFTEPEPKGLDPETMMDLAVLADVYRWALEVVAVLRLVSSLTFDDVVELLDEVAAALIIEMTKEAESEIRYLFSLNPIIPVAAAKRLPEPLRRAALATASSAISKQGKEIGMLMGVAVTEVAVLVLMPV